MGRALQSLPQYSRIIRDKISLSESAASIYARLNNASVYLDSSKKAIRAYYFMRYIRESTSVVLLIRDGRATVNSIMKNLGINSVEKACRIWENTILSKQKLFDSVSPENRVLIRYEDLCSSPSSSLAPVFQMLNVAETNISNVVDPSLMHISGNRMSQKGKQNISLNEAWQRQLSTAQLNTISKCCSELNSEYGYV